VEKVYGVMVAAYPRDAHPKYYPWQSATILALVKATQPSELERIVRKQITDHHWNVIEIKQKAPVNEFAVKQQGGEYWETYQRAAAGETCLIESLDQLSPANKGEAIPPMAPKINEPFMDRVLIAAGGRRLTETDADPQKTRNADYFLDEYVFELKILKEEGLLKATRQEKLATLFSKEGLVANKTAVDMDPTELTHEAFRTYLDVVGGPIKTAVKSASGQIKKTAAHVGNPGLKGGIIFVNSGYGSLPPSLFEQSVERFVKKDSNHIDVVVCISAWFLTNGFDSSIHFKFYPEDSNSPTILRLRDAFWKCENEWMTDFARSGFHVTGDVQSPLQPISFEHAGISFYALPPVLPSSWEEAIRNAGP
jgi:hypothetical protein